MRQWELNFEHAFKIIVAEGVLVVDFNDEILVFARDIEGETLVPDRI